MRVLLAEDNARLSTLIAEGLSEQGFTVDRLATLSEAEESAVASRYDLLLIDLGMPDGDGVDFIRALRRKGDTTPVLVITARNGLGDRVGGLDFGGGRLPCEAVRDAGIGGALPRPAASAWRLPRHDIEPREPRVRQRRARGPGFRARGPGAAA